MNGKLNGKERRERSGVEMVRCQLLLVLGDLHFRPTWSLARIASSLAAQTRPLKFGSQREPANMRRSVEEKKGRKKKKLEEKYCGQSGNRKNSGELGRTG